MEKAIEDLLHQFPSVSLKGIGHSKLMNRFDFKFVFHQSLLENILSGFLSNWHILDIEKKKGAWLQEPLLRHPGKDYLPDAPQQKTKSL